jgi:chaperonin GroEL
MKYLKHEINPTDLKRGIETARSQVLEFLEEIAVPCLSLQDYYNVAKVATNYCENIAEVVSKAVYTVGENGAIEIEPGYNKDTELVISDGISINRGFATQEFLTDNRTKISLSNPLILTTHTEITQMS